MGASNCPERHREVVAAAASLKAAARALATAVDNQQQQPNAAAAAAKVCDAAARTVGAAEELKALLRGAGAGDVPQWLPLASSRRLVELNLPDALAALLDACSGAAAPCGNEGDHAAALWPAVHGAAECMTLLGSVAGRASARSPEPVEVLLQIAGGPLAAACTRYLQHAAAAAVAAAGSASVHVEAAVSAAAALTAPFGALVTAATAAAKAAGELRAQLVYSCCGSGLLAAACEALMTASRRCKVEGSAEAQARVARACEDAAAGLLSLAVYLATPRPSAGPDDGAAGGEPGSPLSGPLASSPMFSYVLATASSSGGTSGGDSPLASSGCGDTPKRLLSSTGLQSGAAAVEPEVLIALGAPGVRAFLEERLKHVLQEAKGANGKDLGPTVADDTPAPGLGLLPGRTAAASSEGPLGVARSVLLCWRAMLLGTGDSRRSLADPTGGAPALMAAVLTACVGQAGGRGSWGVASAESAVARCMVAASECLHAVIDPPAGCPPKAGPGDANALLRPAAAAAAWAAAAAAAAWDAAKAKRTGHELPYSRQIKCADRATAQALESCGAAATAAIALTRTLLAAATAPPAGGLFCKPPAAAGPSSAWAAVAGGGTLPALEALLRRVPPTAAAHVAAVALLADLLPHMAVDAPAAAADGAKDAAAALVTLRKFMARAAACGVVGPSEAAAAGDVAAAGVQLLETILDEADAMSTCCGDAGAASGGLATFAVAQLVPGLQALIAGMPKGPRAASLAASLISSLSRAADVQLGLTPILLAHGSAPFCASALTRTPIDSDPPSAARLIASALAFAGALVPAPSAPGGDCCAAACGRPAVAPALATLLQSRLLAELQAALGRMADAQTSGGADSGDRGRDGRALARTASAPPMQAAPGMGAAALLSSFSLRRTATGITASPFAIAMAANGAADGAEPPAVVLGSSAPAAGPCFGPCLGSCGSFVSAGGCSGDDGLWDEAAALQELRGRLDGVAMRAASAVLALCGSAAATAKSAVATSTAGTAATEAARAPATRAGPEEALASLRAAAATAAAAAAAARPAATSADGAPPGWSVGGVVRGASAPLPGFDYPMEGAPVLAWGAAPSSDAAGRGGPQGPDGAGEQGGVPLPLLYSVGSADGALGAAADYDCASPTAAGPGAAEPLPAEVSKRLLRALQAAAPAALKAAAAQAGAAADPQTLPRALPALAAFRVGCWSATCASAAGASEAAAPLKPCAGGCGAARFCSRACASAAYAAHLPDCRPQGGACAGACRGAAFA